MANKAKKSKKVKSVVSISTPFHERFNIRLDVKEAKEHFLNRVENHIFLNFFGSDVDKDEKTRVVLWQVANALGVKFERIYDFDDYVNGDFRKCLQVLEVSYNALTKARLKEMLSYLIKTILEKSEIDLGVSWENGKFVPTGAKLLDQKLVNEPLRWLSDPRYKNVYAPFAKGLSYFLEAEKHPESLPDVITDMYEALEALSKVVTGRNKELSGNAELFIRKINASQHYKPILKKYITYACEFRHALEEGKERPTLSVSEVESFIYLTGLFIRLAIGKT
jgi:hypothetical protein